MPRVLMLPNPTLVWLRVLVLLLAIACFWRLQSRGTLTLAWLRSLELVLVGILGVQTAALQFTGMQAAGLRHDPVEVTGSPLYMSPEQATGGEPDFRSDIYSLGATAYCLLTGQPPFSGTNTAQVLRAHAEERVVPPSELRPEVPVDLEAVVLGCLVKEPENRFADVRQVEDALAKCACSGQWTEQLAAEWWNQLEGRKAQDAR